MHRKNEIVKGKEEKKLSKVDIYIKAIKRSLERLLHG